MYDKISKGTVVRFDMSLKPNARYVVIGTRLREVDIRLETPEPHYTGHHTLTLRETEELGMVLADAPDESPRTPEVREETWEQIPACEVLHLGDVVRFPGSPNPDKRYLVLSVNQRQSVATFQSLGLPERRTTVTYSFPHCYHYGIVRVARAEENVR